MTTLIDQHNSFMDKLNQNLTNADPYQIFRYQDAFNNALQMTPHEVLDVFYNYKMWTINISGIGAGLVVNKGGNELPRFLDQKYQNGSYKNEMANYENWVSTAIMIAGNAGLAKANHDHGTYERAINSARKFDERARIFHVEEWVNKIWCA